MSWSGIAQVRIRTAGGVTQSGPLGSLGFQWGGTAASALPGTYVPNNVGQAYQNPFSIAATTSLTVSLLGDNGELDFQNLPLSFALVTFIYVVVTNPQTGLYLKIGPQSVTNGWIGPWRNAAYAEDIHEEYRSLNSIDGYAVGSTNKIITLTNPTSIAATGVLLVAGTHT